VTLPAFAAESRAAAPLLLSAGACYAALAELRPLLLMDISCPQGAQYQTHWPLLLLSIDGTDRQTDGRFTVRAASLTQVMKAFNRFSSAA